MRSLCHIGLFLKEHISKYINKQTTTWPSIIESLLAGKKLSKVG